MKVGVILRMTEDGSGIPAYRVLRDVARAAEDHGLDSVWVCDHMMFRFPNSPMRGTWEAASLAAGIAEATSSVDIGTLVLCAGLRNPAMIAKTAITLDEISGGRLVLGLGAGWHEPEFDACGLPFDHPVGRFEEALQIIVPLLRTGAVDFHGRFHRAERCALRPRGPRAGEIPIVIGGEQPRLLRLAHQFGDAWNTAWHDTPAQVDERLEAVARSRNELGNGARPIAVTVGASVAFDGGGDESARDERAAYLLTGLRSRGVEHVICDVSPFGIESVVRLADIVAGIEELATSELA